MRSVHTHYDTLKVSRTAPPEIIKAAYKALSQKYHPDKNPGNANAANIMATLNAAYEILSDPERRRRYDQSIAKAERARRAAYVVEMPRKAMRPGLFMRLTMHVGRILTAIVVRVAGGFIGLVALFGLLWVTTVGVRHLGFGSENLAASDQDGLYSKPIYKRPMTAPNGQPWPDRAGYLSGYPILNRAGLSTLTIDNTASDADVFVKVFNLDGPAAVKVRHIFIPGGARFKAAKFNPGTYDVRYQELDTGAKAASKSFMLEERDIESGIEVSNITMTLYRVSNGNMRMRPIEDSEFE